MTSGTENRGNRYRHFSLGIDRPPVEGGIEGLIAALYPEISDTIERLTEKSSLVAKADPIVAEEFTQISGLVSSAFKRHGLILERTILERLKQCPHFIVWNDNNLKVHDVDGFKTRGEETGRGLQVDAFVYDKNTGSLRSYEIKRGFAYFDSGKRKSIESDLRAVEATLRSYGNQRSLEVTNWSSHVIFWYGKLSVKRPFGLAGRDLDEHFGWPIHQAVEQVNQIFSAKLNDALSRIVRARA